MHQNVIIIIGLPGSGKTTISKKFDNFVIFDDFISYYYNGKIIESLKTEKNICLIDPRLCIFSIFQKYIYEIEKFVDRNNIKLLLFENDINKCLNNIKKIDQKKQGIEKIIFSYSKNYILDNYKSWNTIIYSIHT